MPDVILKHIPGMKHASGVPVLRAEELSESVFIGEYVSNSKPCVIRGAVKHWAAVQNWRDKNHLKKRCGHYNVSLFSSDYYARWDRLGPGKRDMSFAEAIDHLHAEETKIGIVVTSLTELQTDLGGLSFMTKAEPAFTYEAARYFFYRNAGTTWHFHSFDETLMSQIVGSKKIGLLKTNTPSYLAMLMLFLKEEYYDDPSVSMDSTARVWSGFRRSWRRVMPFIFRPYGGTASFPPPRRLARPQRSPGARLCMSSPIPSSKWPRAR